VAYKRAYRVLVEELMLFPRVGYNKLLRGSIGMKGF
jgi:hypothetical protein